MHLQDSIASEPIVSAIIADTIVQKPTRPQTPYQVLRLLPKDATPAQQDSAIQAWFQPGEVRYSEQPDTLHLPGHGIGRSPKDVNLPQYYRESFFAKDTLLHPELTGGRYGVAGDPVAYTVRNDDAITCILLFCFMLPIVVFSYSRHIITHQLKAFFHPMRNDSTTFTTSRFMYFLGIQTCLLMGISYYFYTIHFVTDDLLIDTPYILIGLFSVVCFMYIIGKQLVYHLVNTVFFDSKRNGHWTWTLAFITALEGIALFPAVILQVYFTPSFQNILFYIVFVIILTKILTFYKCWNIFFRQKGVYLQIILYLCALEIVPMLVLWGVLVMITNELKVIF
jgi:hypothetical protein